MEEFTLNFKVPQNKFKEFSIKFIVNPDIATGNAILTDRCNDKKFDIANDVVIYLVELFKDNIPEILQYETSEPYWLFHDICHALYSPEYFIPKVITIPREVERNLWIEGLKLARECKLDEKYLSRISVLKEFL